MSIFTIISVNCIKPKYDYIDGMIATTLTPIFVTGVLLLLYTIQHLKIVYGKYLVDGYEKKAEIQSRLFAAGAQNFTMFLLLTFLVLPGVTINIAGRWIDVQGNSNIRIIIVTIAITVLLALVVFRRSAVIS